jgi:hypothetical protein
LHTRKVTPIGKLAFNCLVGLCKSQMAMFVWGLLNQKYISRERLTKFEREDTLKTMSEYYWDYKKCNQIHNEIGIFHGFLRSTCNNRCHIWWTIGGRKNNCASTTYFSCFWIMNSQRSSINPK